MLNGRGIRNSALSIRNSAFLASVIARLRPSGFGGQPSHDHERRLEVGNWELSARATVLVFLHDDFLDAQCQFLADFGILLVALGLLILPDQNPHFNGHPSRFPLPGRLVSGHRRRLPALGDSFLPERRRYLVDRIG